MTFAQRLEETGQIPNPKFGSRENEGGRVKHLFESLGSHGANNERLARLLIAWDFVMTLLKQKDVSLSQIVTQYQASINAKYHDDYKSVATIEELDERLAKRRSGSVMKQSQGGLV